MLTYSQVEAVLAQLHFIDSEKMGAFRGRIKHFQRIGIVPASPGKGKKISYEIKDLLRWAYCFELAQFGIDPTVIKAIVPGSFGRFIAAFNNTNSTEFITSSNNMKFNQSDYYFVIFPNIMTSGIYADSLSLSTPLKTLAATNVVIDSLGELEKFLKNEYVRADEPSTLDTLWRRMLVINVAALRRRLEISLRAIPNVPADLLKYPVLDPEA